MGGYGAVLSIDEAKKGLNAHATWAMGRMKDAGAGRESIRVSISCLERKAIEAKR